jgi:hypothetical protein
MEDEKGEIRKLGKEKSWGQKLGEGRAGTGDCGKGRKISDGG